MRRLTPKQAPNRKVYVITFNNPRTSRRSTYSLETTEEVIAQAICRDLEALSRNRAIWQLNPKDPQFQGYHRRALQIFFPEKADEFEDIEHSKEVLTSDDIHTLLDKIMPFRKVGDHKFHRLPVDPKEIMDAIITFMPRNYRQLQDSNLAKDQELRSLRDEVEYLRAENSRLSRLSNAHCKASIGSAFTVWKKIYPQDHEPQTAKEAETVVESFITALPERGKFRLGDVRGPQVQGWLDDLKSQDGGLLSPVTRNTRKAYLSTFFTWCCKKYDLHENPVANTGKISKNKRQRQEIKAIDRPEDISAFLEALVPWPYWRAWCAVACLAGPRFSEQVRMKMNHVHLDDGYIQIYGKKTGKLRHVPIEQTLLLPILKAHTSHRRREQKAPKDCGSPEGAASDWLFPTILPAGIIERTKSPAGQWSHNSAWHSAWSIVEEQAMKRSKRPTAQYWTKRRRGKILERGYGPAEWRHTFGTTLNGCGFSDLRIADAMGNTPEMARQYYCRPVMGGVWPFKYS